MGLDLLVSLDRSRQRQEQAKALLLGGETESGGVNVREGKGSTFLSPVLGWASPVITGVLVEGSYHTPAHLS